MSITPQIPDHVLMVGFGGPTPGCCRTFDDCPGQAYCFVSGIFGHNEARKKRIDEVAAHYEQFGGYSRFNEETMKQAGALESELQRRGINLRVRCGFHHWMPYARTTIDQLSREGSSGYLVLIMSPHQCSVSWDQYLRIVGEGVTQYGEGAAQPLGVIEPWWVEDGFISAIADRIRHAANRAGVDLADRDTGLLLSAHAVPESVSRTAPYCRQIEETAAAVAKELGFEEFALGYQSQPSDSRIPWTSPSLEGAIDELKDKGKKTILGAAIGFLCDNVEVLHDLGVEGREHAESLGLRLIPAECVHDHPAFIAMLADRVEQALTRVGQEQVS